MRRRLIALVLFGALAEACGEPSVDVPDGGTSQLDATNTGQPPAKPTIDAAPTRQPYAIVTLHGRAQGARRVIVEGGGNPIASTVLPDNTFCVDVRVDQPGVYSFAVLAQGDDGRLSEAAGPVSIEYDPAAPGIPGLATCSGADPAGCQSAIELCDNGRDDDCNNLVDARDPDCATCTDDAFEPNDDPAAPRIDPGRHDELKICPANQDYFGVYARSGETINARIFFVHANGNLDLRLVGLDRRTVLQRSASVDDDEMLTHTASVTGEYELVVYSDQADDNEYALDLRIE